MIAKIKNVHGLLIGINDFAGSGNDLSGCVNDVTDMSQLLLKNSSATSERIASIQFFHSCDHVTVLTDRQAKLKSAVEAIGTFLGTLQEGDLGFMWFSQHGTFVKDKDNDEPDGTDEALVFQDLGLLIDDDFSKMLRARNPKSYVFVGTDACHSGTVSRLYEPQDRYPLVKVRYLSPTKLPKVMQPLPHQLRTPGKSRVASPTLTNVIHMAGCQDTEYCWDAVFRGRPNGAFQYYAMKSLTRLTPGATFGDWFKEICTFLPSVEYAQTPRCNAKRSLLALPLPLRKG